MPRRTPILIATIVAAACLPAGAAAAPPKGTTLQSGWEIRDLVNRPPAPTPPPPSESGEGEVGSTEQAPVPVEPFNPNWKSTNVPDVFAADANPSLFGGTAKQYRLRFTAPPKASGYTWAFRFEGSHRRTTVFLNGRRLGVSIDPYTPFELPARGLRAGRQNDLVVTVDSRKDPRLPEAWWNYGGIVRPVKLIPRGRVGIQDVGLLSNVTCKGLAQQCKAGVKLDGILAKLPKERQSFRTVTRVVGKGKRRRRVSTRVKVALPQPKLVVKLRSPQGRLTRKAFRLKGLRSARQRLKDMEVRVPGPKLWSPDNPQLYSASASLVYKGRTEQVDRKKIGLRSVKVVRGELRLNNRPINVRGGSIHEDMPGHGAALTAADMDTIVRELKEVGANTTRAHYLMNEGLLERFDKAGIMVWNQAPIWQRDHGANLLQYSNERRRAMAQMERTVKGGRNHPSVITHSVSNELSFTPDRKAGTRRYLIDAAEKARDLDPSIPISLDIKGRPGFEEQFVYENFDMIGINQYFGWYPWVEDFNTLEPYLREMNDLYPNHAKVMTEFGAEGRADMSAFPPETLGTYAFQANHVARTVDLVNRLPFMAGAIHWTMREFEINPGWLGGVRMNRPGRNTRHYKGVLTYNGKRKPAWTALHDRYVRTPLYRR
ncbi:MAG TPA: glycoside hydrolase family 2 TIM barrel-domain containing protein [Thermoleophilaceae bacterium]|nr:glycoside hydrolase family 2 TIM barrel-domain containing protein [Thermoleophilaceae bacterium]